MILLEDSIASILHQKFKNQRDTCDYNCGQKFAKDAFVQPKVEACKANCDVVFTTMYIKTLQRTLAKQTLDPKDALRIRNKIDSATRQLFNARKRLFKTKMKLKKVLYGRRASESMRPVQNGGPFEKGVE